MSSTKILGMLERMLLYVGRSGYLTLFFPPFMPPTHVTPTRRTSDVTR